MDLQNEVSIRLAEEKDLSLILKLYEQGFIPEHDSQVLDKSSNSQPYLERNDQSSQMIAEYIANTIKDPEAILLLAEFENQIVGFISCKIQESKSTYVIDKFGIIDGIYVNPDYQGKKISTKLKNELIKWLKNKHIQHISTTVLSDNEKTIKIYEKWGFIKFSTELRAEIK